MDFTSAINFIENKGFSWAKFRELFPFGDISIREGNYQKLVTKVLEQLGTSEQKELLLDMLDTQLCIFLEQVWIQNEQANDDENKPFPVEGHVITAQLQINSNMRWELSLRKRDARGMMLNLSEDKLLLDRMMVPSKSTDETTSEISSEN